MSLSESKYESILLIPCSGSEYNGELARRVAIKLNENSPISSKSSMFCSTIFIKNLLLKKEKLIEITRNNLESNFIVAIDGCKTSCESLILNNVGIKPDMIIHVDDFIPKERLNFNDLNAFKDRAHLSDIKEEHISKIIQVILDKLNKRIREEKAN
ncbi:MAG: putative zinc-binding protein [Candidatus Lokiarchaeota archaeon]